MTHSIHDSPDVQLRFTSGLGLADMNARQFRRQMGGFVELPDLISYAQEGLFVAAKSYNHEYGVPFDRWANLKIRCAIIDGMRASGVLPRGAYRHLRMLQAAEDVRVNHSEEYAASLSRGELTSGEAALGEEAADEKVDRHIAAVALAMAVGLLTTPVDDAEPVDETNASPEDALARGELLSHIRGCISRLPDTERKLLEFHYFEGMTMDAAAAKIGLSKSWGSRLHARAVEAVALDLRRVLR